MTRIASPVSRALATLAIGFVGLTVALSPQLSSAVYTSTSVSAGSVAAAVDWTPPKVQVTSPGPLVSGKVAVTFAASDGETGVAAVTLEVQAPGSSAWTPICAPDAGTSPWSCTWSTTGLAEGTYALRARATDGSGLTATSEVVRTTVANAARIVLNHPGDVIRGTVPLLTSVDGVGSAGHTVRLEYAVSDTTTWRSICTGLTSPYACSWNTAAVASGDHDLRAVLVVGGVTTYSPVVEGVTVDNVAPTVSLATPGSPLSGTRTFSATAGDEHSDVRTVTVQAAAAGTSTWREVCMAATEPWSCRVDTRALADGTWSFRAVAVDLAGNTATSATVSNVRVDNTVSWVSVEAPDRLVGTVTVAADASSTAGVASVLLQYAPTGSGTWTDLCTDTTSPYACTWDTTAVRDGAYDLRAVLIDGTGVTTTSSVSSHQVDNSPLRGADVQTANGGSTPGKVEAGDSITFAYGTEVDPASVLAGWDGSARTVTVRFRDGVLVGRNANQDGLDVLDGSRSVHLGAVNLKQDYIKAQATVLVSATMTAATETVDGQARTVVAITFNQITSNAQRVKTVAKTSTMVWSPSAAVTDLQGSPCSTAAVTERGALDREF